MFRKRSLSWFLVAGMCAVVCSTCSLSFAAVYTVSNEMELSNAFTLAGAGDSILFTPHTGITLSAGLTHPTGGFSINGQDSNLSGDNTFRLFDITGNLGGISNLTLQGGNAGAILDGGAVSVSGASSAPSALHLFRKQRV